MTEIINVPWQGVSGGSCELQTGHAENPARSFEYDQTLNLSGPRWVLRVRLSDRDGEQGGRIRAFLARLAALGGRFRCFDPLRRRPLQYALTATRGWLANTSVEASIVSIAASTYNITVGGLAIGAIFKPGDALSYAFGGEQRLYRIVNDTDVVANASGQATFMVVPRPRAASVGTAVRFDNATSVFKLIGQEPAGVDLVPGPLPVSVELTAIEVL